MAQGRHCRNADPECTVAQAVQMRDIKLGLGLQCTLLCRVAQVLADHMKVPVVRSDMILEGGSVHTDGEGCAP